MNHPRAVETLVVISHAMHEVMSVIRQVANDAMPVFIEGEAGTGRRLLARAIHEESARRNKPLVIVRCDMLTVESMDRILFGDGYGTMQGKLEEAEGGTLVLSEMEDLNPVAQERLTRLFRESRYITGNGGARRIDCRIIATGDRAAIMQQVKIGRFSDELLSALSHTVVHMPSLAERRDDIPHLVVEFLRELATREHIDAPTVPYHYMELLMTVAWPENARQLRNHVESVMVLSNGMFDAQIIREHFQPEGHPATIKGALQTLWTRIRAGSLRPVADQS